MNASEQKFWQTPGYPDRYVIEDVEYYLHGQTKWFRLIRSNSDDPCMQRITISRFIDGSAQIDQAVAELESDKLSTDQRAQILTALKFGGARILAQCPEKIREEIQGFSGWTAPG